MPEKERVVITGLGFVSNHSKSKEELWEKIEKSFQKPAPIKRFNTDTFNSHTGYDCSENFNIKYYTADPKVARKEFFSKLAVAAAIDTLRDAGIDMKSVDPERIGSILTTVHGPIDVTFKLLTDLEKTGPENVSPNYFQQTVLNVAGGQLSILLNLKGVSTTLVGCSSISYAYHLIQTGKADLVLAGSVEEMHEHIYYSYDKLSLLATDNGDGEYSLPWSKRANGAVLGDGSGFVLLEGLKHAKQRNAKIYAEILEHKTRTDKHFCKVFNEFNEDSAFLPLMQNVLEKRNIRPTEVDLISLAANSYPGMDNIELNAVRALSCNGQSKYSLVASKAIFGETLGNSEIFAVIAALLCFERNRAPGLRYLSKQEATEIPFIDSSKRTNIRYALANSFFVGGNVNCLLLENMVE